VNTQNDLAQGPTNVPAESNVTINLDAVPDAPEAPYDFSKSK
jgi:hypothetical protein